MLDYRTVAVALVISVLLHTVAGAQQSNPQNPSPAIRPTVCPPVQVPVCAVLAGDRQSYWNECLAQRAGAIILRSGECPNRTFIGY